MATLDNHAAIKDRLIRQADEELARGDALQASEKAWGAAVHALKAIAQGRGWRHDSHRGLFTISRRLSQETEDPEIRTLFGVASSLHTNFYEGWMDSETVAGNVGDVKRLLDKLQGV